MDVARTDVSDALPDPASLPALYAADPAAALTAAEAWIAARPGPTVLARACQIAGTVRRDRGDQAAAAALLRRGLAAAVRSGDRDLTADVRATYGATLAIGGRRRAGLRHLDRAVDAARGAGRAAVLTRRAYVHVDAADPTAALADIRRGLAAARPAGARPAAARPAGARPAAARPAEARLWEARLLHLRCDVRMGSGDVAAARRDALAAGSLFDALGLGWLSAQAQHNRAQCAALAGDLVVALREFEQVAASYRALGVDEPLLVVDRIGALLAAGLATDAAALATAALDTATVTGPRRAPLLLAAAVAGLAAGRADAADEHARAAARIFRAAQRPSWAARSALLSAQARTTAGERSVRLVRDATAVAGDAVLPPADRPAAQLLLARLATARGDRPAARSALTAVATNTRGPALARATAWLARAELADLAGDDRRVRHACARGLAAVDEHRAVFGAVEVRAASSVHGAAFADLAARSLLRRGSARQLLASVERSRATVLADPTPAVVEDPELARRLAVARAAASTRHAGGGDGAAAVAAAERDVRAHRMTAAGARPERVDEDLPAALAELGDRTLVELVVVDGGLHTLVARGGRVRRNGHTVAVAEVLRQTEFLRFALRRATTTGGNRAKLERAAELLQDALFGPGVELGDNPVLVPPAALHHLPWSALPVFRDRPVVVAPSLRIWRRAHEARRARRHGVVLAAGPGLATGGREIHEVAPLYPAARVLGAGGPPATAEHLLGAMEGARLVHLAAHGSLRADSPMFSALHVDGGPLFVHDVERLHRAPTEVVLASCHSGLGADVGADQLLGTATALLRAGSAAVLTSTMAVDDVATVGVTVDVHRALAAGAPLSVATMRARRAAWESGDPAAAATAVAFSVWGA